MLCFGRSPLSFDPFFAHGVETEKEQPILRGKEVEGKLLIGYTEHSFVLFFPPKFHLSQVQSTVIGKQHLKLILTVNTVDRIYRGTVTFQSHPSDVLCKLTNQYNTRACYSNCKLSYLWKWQGICNYWMFEGGYVWPKISAQAAFQCNIYFDMFYSFSLNPEQGGGEAMLGTRLCFQSTTALPRFSNHYSNENDLLPHPCA